MIDSLDVDRSDVISQQHQLVSVNLTFVFRLNLVECHQTRLQQASNKSTCTSKGVNDVNTIAAQGLAELVF
ncbi:hypothetical protein D3C85_1673370 [compost metagenome]